MRFTRGRILNTSAEWEWQQEDPSVWGMPEALEVHTAFVFGDPVRTVILINVGRAPGSEPDDVLAGRLGVENPFESGINDDGNTWTDFRVHTEERDGLPGLEMLSEFKTLAEAKAAVEADRDALVRRATER